MKTDTKALKQVASVSGAVWTDLNGDGVPELVLACEWGPLVALTMKGALARSDPRVGTGRCTLVGGTGLNAGDFDGDGRMDLVASNRGAQSRDRATRNLRAGSITGTLAGREISR